MALLDSHSSIATEGSAKKHYKESDRECESCNFKPEPSLKWLCFLELCRLLRKTYPKEEAVALCASLRQKPRQSFYMASSKELKPI